MDKLSLRAMYLKYEYESKNTEDHKIDSQSLIKSKAGFNNFLKYFSAIQQRDVATFK